jgi:hypothetical protein
MKVHSDIVAIAASGRKSCSFDPAQCGISDPT